MRLPPGLDKLEELLQASGPAAIAVSGGVDSMTLVHVALRAMHPLGVKPVLFHAVSPAVPVDATGRVRRHAEREGWDLRCVDAGELQDARYLANPVNRCYFCKTNLYDHIRRAWSGPLFSGTNLDDLSDYRPGLIAAQEHQVRHPFVEAGMAKAGVRAIATYLGLHDLATLPAQPCLSSRIETGIAIDPAHLRMIDRVETHLRDLLGPGDLRCRLRCDGLHVEVDSALFANLDQSMTRMIKESVLAAAHDSGLTFSGLSPYVRGSAFIKA